MANHVVVALIAGCVSGCMELPDFGAESAAREVALAYVSDVTGADPHSVRQHIRIAGGKAYVSAEHSNGFNRCDLVLRRANQESRAGWQVERATCGYAT